LFSRKKGDAEDDAVNEDVGECGKVRVVLPLFTKINYNSEYLLNRIG